MAKQTPEKAGLVGMLRKVPLFSGLDEKELKEFVEVGREESFESGKTILRRGRPGLSFLLVLEGKVEVPKGGKTVATLGPRGGFSER